MDVAEEIKKQLTLPKEENKKTSKTDTVLDYSLIPIVILIAYLLFSKKAETKSGRMTKTILFGFALLFILWRMNRAARIPPFNY